jgi:hypothetical protein
MKRRRAFAALLVVLAGVSLVLAVPASRHHLLVHIGATLIAEDPLAPADLIVLAPDAGLEGVLEVADLIRDRRASRVLVLGDPLAAPVQALRQRGLEVTDAAEQAAGMIERLGAPQVTLERVPESGTSATAELVSQWSQQHRIRSVIIVTGADHSRRMRRVLRRAVGEGGPAVMVRPSAYSEFRASDWWTKRSNRRIGIVELQKLLLDVLRHPLS